jgi:hypothetical protein
MQVQWTTSKMPLPSVGPPRAVGCVAIDPDALRGNWPAADGGSDSPAS